MIVSVGLSNLKFIVSATPRRYMLILSAFAQDPYKRDSYEKLIFPKWLSELFGCINKPKNDFTCTTTVCKFSKTSQNIQTLKYKKYFLIQKKKILRENSNFNSCKNLYSLNPYSNGRYSMRHAVRTPLISTELSLNPYYDGTYSIRMLVGTVEDVAKQS